MAVALSTPDEHAFQHTELEDISSSPAGPSAEQPDVDSTESVEQAFEVDQTIRLILEGGYKTIGLQFPDELLGASVKVFRGIQKGIQGQAQAYVLADSTYGSCCPDVLSCLHLPADLLVHYGHACLTLTDALPVHYVFPRKKLDVPLAASQLFAAAQEDVGEKKGVIVMWDVAYDWLAEEIVSGFSKASSLPIAFALIQRPALRATSSSQSTEPTNGDKGKAPALRSIDPPAGVDKKDCIIFYIGEHARSILNLQMTHAANSIYAYAPSSSSVTPIHPTSSKLLSKRLYAVHQAMSSDVFGLIVSNIGLASSRPLLEQLRNDLKAAKKKSYTLSVGRLNPAKLANFAEIECFVLIGCNEGGVVDSKDFLAPIITPWELQLALSGAEHWDPSKWTLDLGAVLDEMQQKDSSTGIDDDEVDKSDEELEFSLITGKYRTKKQFDDPLSAKSGQQEDGQAVVVRNQEFTLTKLESAGSQFLASREFRGLEPRYGLDEPAVLEQGRKGIARGYTEEKA